MTQTATEMAEAPLSADAVSQFFQEAAAAVGDLARATAVAAMLFRKNELTVANDALAALPAELRNFIIMVTVVESQLGIERAVLTLDGLAPAGQIVRLGEWLQSLVEAQTNDDPLTIADILEYDIEPFLRAWQQLLTATVVPHGQPPA